MSTLEIGLVIGRLQELHMAIHEQDVAPSQRFVMPIAIDQRPRPGAQPIKTVNVKGLIIGQNHSARMFDLAQGFVPKALATIVVQGAAVISIAYAPAIKDRRFDVEFPASGQRPVVAGATEHSINSITIGLGGHGLRGHIRIQWAVRKIKIESAAMFSGPSMISFHCSRVGIATTSRHVERDKLLPEVILIKCVRNKKLAQVADANRAIAFCFS